MTNISEKVLKKIKCESIHVTPRWKFLLKNYTVWILCAVSILVGGFGFSVTVFLVSNNDWGIYAHLHKSFAEYLIIVAPHVWVVFVLFFVLVACYNARHTRHGYRYRAFWLVGVGILGSIVFGSVLYFAGLGMTIDKIFLDTVPYYGKVVHRYDKYWNNAPHGLLGGKITAIGTDTTFLLRDLINKDWTVLFDQIPVVQRGIVEEGNLVKLVGKMQTENIFTANDIRRWDNSRFNIGE